MKPTQIRGDDHVGNQGRFTRVIARKNHIFSSNVSARMAFQLTVYAKPERDEEVDRLVEYPSKLPYAHIIEPRLHVSVDDLIVNKCHERSSFRPNASVNAWDHSPADRAQLLPYLCEDIILKNATMARSSATMDEWRLNDRVVYGAGEFDEARMDHPNHQVFTESFTYNPRVCGKIFVTTQEKFEPIAHTDRLYSDSAVTIKYFQQRADDRTGFDKVVQFASAQQWDAIEDAYDSDEDLDSDDGDDTNEKAFEMNFSRDSKMEYKTDLEGTALIMSASNFENSSTTVDGNRPTGMFRFPLTFNVGFTIGRDGTGLLRAFNFAGEDISESVRHDGFYRMEIYSAYKDSAWDGNPQVYSHSNEEYRDKHLNEWPRGGAIYRTGSVCLYLPIRRYSLTDRNDTHDENSVNRLPYLQSAPRNVLIDHFKKASQELSSGFVSDQLAGTDCVGVNDQMRMVYLKRLTDRQLNYEPLTIRTVSLGDSPKVVWGNAGNDRRLMELTFPVDSDVGRYLEKSRIDVDQDDWKVLVMEVTRRWEETGGRLVKDDLGANGGWYPHGNGTQFEYDDTGDNARLENAADKLYIFYKEDGFNRVNKNYVLNGNCLILYDSVADGNEVTADMLERLRTTNDNTQTRFDEYSSLSITNKMRDPEEEKMGAFFPEPIEFEGDTLNELLDERIVRKGYAHSLSDNFYIHPCAGVEFDGTGAFQNTRNGRQAVYGGTYESIGETFVFNLPGRNDVGGVSVNNLNGHVEDHLNAVSDNDPVETLEAGLEAMQAVLTQQQQELGTLQDTYDWFVANDAEASDIQAAQTAITAKQQEIVTTQGDIDTREVLIQLVLGNILETHLLQNTTNAILLYEQIGGEIVDLQDARTILLGVRVTLNQQLAAFQQARIQLVDDQQLAAANLAPYQDIVDQLDAKTEERQQLIDNSQPVPDLLNAEILVLTNRAATEEATRLQLTVANAEAQAHVDANQQQITMRMDQLQTNQNDLDANEIQSDLREDKLISMRRIPLLEIVDGQPGYLRGAHIAYLEVWEARIVVGEEGIEGFMEDLPVDGDGNFLAGWEPVGDAIVHDYNANTTGIKYFTNLRNFLFAYQARNAFDWIKEYSEEVLQSMTPVLYVIPDDQLLGDAEVRSNMRKCVSTDVYFEETLLTVGGASTFMPSSILPVVPQYSPLFQDFEFGTSKFANFYRTDRFCKYDDVVGVFEPLPHYWYQLNTKSKDIFDQSEKSLQSIAISVPQFETFSKTFTRDTGSTPPAFRVPFSTVNGPPDYVFIQAVRAVEADDLYTRYSLQLRRVQLEIMNQDIKSLSTLNSFRLREATRTNSNVRADLRQLQLDTGAILLSKEDFVDFVDFKKLYGAKDQLQGAFIVKQDDVISQPEGIEADNPDSAIPILFFDQDITIIVRFIYMDHILEGQAGTMRFRMAPERMIKMEDGLA